MSLSDPISRQALEEALDDLSNRPGSPWREVDPAFAAVIDAAAVLLDGEPVEWCVVHGSANRADDQCQVAYWTADLSDLSEPDPCRFESFVRVKVTE